MEQQKSNEDSTFHEDNMVMSVADLFLAGTDTTATTIRWGLIFLTQNPDVQGTSTRKLLPSLYKCSYKID